MKASTWVQLPTLSHVTMLDTGFDHSLALKDDGTVWAWGINERGNPKSMYQTIPLQVPGLYNVTTLAAGSSHSIALKDDGSVWSWGDDYNGELGNGSNKKNASSPLQILELFDITNLSTESSSSHNLVIKGDKTLWAWGLNQSGQLGDGTTTDKLSPVLLNDLSHFSQIATGSDHSVALKEDGSVWAWGFNSSGQLGDGTRINKSGPVEVNGLTHITRVVAGTAYSLALKDDGTVWEWGKNLFRKYDNINHYP
ncbi:MAG: BNR repeat-containing protein [Candidatus Magnetoglobus multicellularis str. Araruama]|uniref:BNR repeat-containing protein n=1 Tax=Candidatus Magnetoglobus multicellularis str. Araruama TaxID=890399 RepID=A0A1V1NSB1_9BACT|nr:MAG: BNR repeat-containing protein [Candidatus Magnetoglobus multicellularis str. Araruama]